MKFETMRLPESVNDDFLIATYYMKSEKEPENLLTHSLGRNSDARKTNEI